VISSYLLPCSPHVGQAFVPAAAFQAARIPLPFTSALSQRLCISAVNEQSQADRASDRRIFSFFNLFSLFSLFSFFHLFSLFSSSALSQRLCVSAVNERSQSDRASDHRVLSLVSLSTPQEAN